MAYTTIDNGSAEFYAFLYTGTGNTGATLEKTFDGPVDIEPGQLWMAKRTAGGNMHNIVSNEYAGPDTFWLASDGGDLVRNDGILTTYNTDGFTLATQNQGGYYHNENNSQYICWAFKKTGASNATNTQGSIQSTVRASQAQGISYVAWAGTGSDGTLGHGLGARPKLIQMMPLDGPGDGNTQKPYWWDANTDGYGIACGLNDSSAAEENDINGLVTADISGEGTATLFSVKAQNSSSANVNASSLNYLAICHIDVQGFKKIGQYVGNGNADGTFVYCGFKPALIWVRPISRSGYTLGFDNARNPINTDSGEPIGMAGDGVRAYSDANTKIDILSNGFKWRTAGSNFNGNGETYAFCAFAEDPFVTSTGTPTTAR